MCHRDRNPSHSTATRKSASSDATLRSSRSDDASAHGGASSLRVRCPLLRNPQADRPGQPHFVRQAVACPPSCSPIMHAAGPFPRRPRAAAPGPAPAQAAGQLEGPPGDPVRLNVIGPSQQVLNRPRDPRITVPCHGTSMFPILGTGASPLSGSWRRRAAARRRNLRIRYMGT